MRPFNFCATLFYCKFAVFHLFVPFFLFPLICALSNCANLPPLIFTQARCAKIKGMRILMGIRYTSIGLNIYITDNYVMNFSNSENASISIILNDIILFRFTLLGTYSNIVSSYHFHRIRLCPWELIRSEKAYCKK